MTDNYVSVVTVDGRRCIAMLSTHQRNQLRRILAGSWFGDGNSNRRPELMSIVDNMRRIFAR